MQRVIHRSPRKAASPYSSYSSDHKETSTFFVTLTRKYMESMPNLGQIEISPPREVAYPPLLLQIRGEMSAADAVHPTTSARA